MMMDLYDQDRILKTHIASERKLAAEEEKEAAIERMLRDGELSVEKIALYLDVSVDKVREIKEGMLREA